ncbi:MAG TPA: FtsX-like permease family protein [Candidatus Acidoferrales bacterium]|nr:FtsX-like permease family protein [Candidatus Acidoferrales bacterium]
MLLTRLAWRSLWRNWRRTLIAMAAVIFAISLSIIQRGIQYGTYAETINAAVRMSTGYLQIQKVGYNKTPTLQKSFDLTPKIFDAIKSISQINGYSPRIQTDGLLSYRDQSLGTMVMGVSPKSEGLVTDFQKKINRGHFLSVGNDRSTTEIVVGYKLLDNLGAKVGDSVVMLAQGFDGTLGNMFVRIGGTFKTGSDEFDRMGTFMDISDLQNFLGMDDRINAVAISVRNQEDVGKIVDRLNRTLKPMGLVALSWQELLPQLKQTIELDNSSGVLYIIILLAVVGFGILNTVLMSITERFREYGVMLSLGMSQERLVVAVALEVFFMLVLGFAIGNGIGIAVNSYFVQHPIQLGGDVAELYREYNFAPVLVSSLSFKIFLDSTLTILGISIVAAVYPLWRVLKLEPLKGIRYT